MDELTGAAADVSKSKLESLRKALKSNQNYGARSDREIETVHLTILNTNYDSNEVEGGRRPTRKH